MVTNEFSKKQQWPLGFPSMPGSFGMINDIWPKAYCRTCQYMKGVTVDGKKKFYCRAAERVNKAILAYIPPASPACDLYNEKSSRKKAKKKKKALGDIAPTEETVENAEEKTDQMDIKDFLG